jgi:uncharacterized protein YraI
MQRRSRVSLLGGLLFAVVGIAGAQDAYTSRPMNVRAGPDREYPLVAQLDAGAPLEVHGCLDDWSWCDVSFDDGRGWVYSGGLSFVYQGARVPLYSYGPRLGLPIIAFSLGAYWGHYYRGRPWYSQRDEWAHRRMPPHMRPPGRPRAGPPPMPNSRFGGRPAPRVEERERAAPERGAIPERAAPSERGAAPERAAPPERRAPPERAAPPERGARPERAAPSERSAPPARSGRGPQAGPPANEHGRSDRGGHGDEHGHRPP